MPCPDTDCSTAAVQRSCRHYFHGDHVPVPVVLAVHKDVVAVIPRPNTIGGRILLGSSLGYPAVYITCYPFGGHAGTKTSEDWLQDKQKGKVQETMVFSFYHGFYQLSKTWARHTFTPSQVPHPIFPRSDRSVMAFSGISSSALLPTRRSCNYPSAACVTYIYT